MRAAVPWVVSALWIVGASLSGSREPPIKIREVQEVRRIRLPVLLDERKPGACVGVGPADLEVSEDGLAVEVTHVEPSRLAASHAIVLDSSHSMLDALQLAKRSAGDYIGNLPADEPALVATVDDSLVLHLPFSSDRVAAKEALAWIETGWGTRLWDALHEVVGYLRSLPGRKILILLSDGCDNEGRSSISPEEAIDFAARTSALSVFPIGLDVPLRCPSSGESPEPRLRGLAESTGGEYHRLGSRSDLPGVFREIRGRLDRETYVTYRPPPFGEGPKDAPGKHRSRWRRLKVVAPGRDGCRAELAGPPVRLEQAAVDPAAEGDPLVYVPDVGARAIRARLTDVTRDAGPLARRHPGATHADVGTVESPGRRSSTRSLRLSVPEADRVIRDDARPSDPFVQALLGTTSLRQAHRLPPVEGGAGHWTEVPFLVNGSTLLKTREALGEALAGFPDYAAWAVERARVDRLADLDAAAFDLGERLDPENLVRVRNQILDPSWNPGPRALGPYLSAWLGDLPAVRLYEAAETMLARELRTAVALGEDVPKAIREIDRAWREVGVWLPAPTEVRLLGLLLPGYDPRADRVGFYRVVLPRPASFLGTWNFSAETPFGVRFVRWILEQPGAAEALLAGQVEIRGVRYDGPADTELLPLVSRARLEGRFDREVDPRARFVSVVFSPRIAPERTFRAGAYFSTKGPLAGTFPEDPLCLVLPASPPPGIVSLEFLEALGGAKLGEPLPCILPMESLGVR